MNPFKKDGQLLPLASINSVYVDNTKASELFRIAVLIKILEKNREQLGFSRALSGESLLYRFNDAICSDIPTIKSKTLEIANDFGDRLASVIKTLKKPSLLSVENRDNWTDEHWDYWKSIRKLYLVGGLTSPILTKIFYQRIEKAIHDNKIADFTVTFIEGSSNLGTKGLSTLCDNGDYLLFDFGQTNIKRAHYMKRNNFIVLDSVLSSVKSDYLFYKYQSDEELKIIAKSLHSYIKSIIIRTCKETDFTGKNIFMGIANYIHNGTIYSARGGYGKLAYLSDNYQKLLSSDLSIKLGREIKVTLHHDTSAMALNFTEKKNAAVISLGTAFGVAFVD